MQLRQHLFYQGKSTVCILNVIIASETLLSKPKKVASIPTCLFFLPVFYQFSILHYSACA